MVPRLAGRGTSFKGAGSYYLHDKDAQTSDRVEWIETVNLLSVDPEKAIRVMTATAIDRDALKIAAGIRAGGRSSDKVVQTYSLAWHPEEQPSKAEMVEAARESLTALGLEEHQALIVCHNDEPHAHVHLIVNRVHPGDGRLSSTSQEKLKISHWAEAWEQRHGKIYCEERVLNNAERERHQTVRAEKEESRQAFEEMRAATRGFNDNREASQAAAELKAEQQKKALDLAALGRAMHEHYRQELGNLGADYQRDKAKIRTEERSAIKALKTENRTMIRETMQTFGAEQEQIRKTVAWREKSMLGRVWNAVDAGRSAESFGGRIGKTLMSTASRSTRLASLTTDQARLRQAVYGEVVGRARQRETDLRSTYKEKFEANYQKFVAARESTLRQYEAEQRDYRRQWAERNEARREAWQQFRKSHEPLERMRQLHEQQKESLRRYRELQEQQPQPSRGRGRSCDLER